MEIIISLDLDTAQLKTAKCLTILTQDLNSLPAQTRTQFHPSRIPLLYLSSPLTPPCHPLPISISTNPSLLTSQSTLLLHILYSSAQPRLPPLYFLRILGAWLLGSCCLRRTFLLTQLRTIPSPLRIHHPLRISSSCVEDLDYVVGGNWASKS